MAEKVDVFRCSSQGYHIVKKKEQKKGIDGCRREAAGRFNRNLRAGFSKYRQTPFITVSDFCRVRKYQNIASDISYIFVARHLVVDLCDLAL